MVCNTTDVGNQSSWGIRGEYILASQPDRESHDTVTKLQELGMDKLGTYAITIYERHGTVFKSLQT